LAGLFAIAQASGQINDTGGGFSSIRLPERDGINCLYLQLRLLEYSGTYETLLAAVPSRPERTSMAELGEAARHLGFNLVPARLTMGELSKMGAPTLVFMEEAGIGSGRFDLLLGFSEGEAHMIDGTFMTCHGTMPIDRFRRGWTGFALVRELSSPWRRRWLGVAFGAVLGAAATWLANRVTRQATNVIR
jgi:ABC-type bacteriocin/lantibiotic exporter with double-glycine peptidase domain